MAIDPTVYDKSQFEVYIGLAAENLGVNAVSSASTLYKMRLSEVNDIDWSEGAFFAEAERTGQRVERPTDHIAVYKGGKFSWTFSDYVVENEALLQVLLQLVSEDTSPSVLTTIIGDQPVKEYAEGSVTGEYAHVVLSNPDTDQDRLMHSSILEELELKMDPTANGGILTASGKFWSGYQPVVADESTSPNSTAVDWQLGFFDCTTKTIGGAIVIVKAFNIKITNPAKRVGNISVNSITGEPAGYNRGGKILVEGSITVKWDDNTVGAYADWLAGTSIAIVIGNGSTINFNIPTAKYTGTNRTFDEDGTFVELPFKGTAEGSASVIEILTT